MVRPKRYRNINLGGHKPSPDSDQQPFRGRLLNAHTGDPTSRWNGIIAIIEHV
jgi:hypothetical protein